MSLLLLAAHKRTCTGVVCVTVFYFTLQVSSLQCFCFRGSLQEVGSTLFFWQERSFTQQQVQEQSCWCSVVSYRSSLGCYSPSPGFWRQSRLWHTRQCVVVSCCRFSCRWNLLRHLLRFADGLHVHTGRFLLLLVLTAAELHLENSLFPC